VTIVGSSFFLLKVSLTASIDIVGVTKFDPLTTALPSIAFASERAIAKNSFVLQLLPCLLFHLMLSQTAFSSTSYFESELTANSIFT
jgi:hypothetical protein